MRRKAVTTRKFNDYTRLFDIDPELARFRQNLVIHPAFEHCEETILSKIAHPVSFNIVSVVGPSGAGKTQLLNEVAGTLLRVGALPHSADAEPEQSETKTPYLPVIYVVAKNGRTYESRYRSLLIEILERANNVLVTIGKTDPSGAIQSPKISKSPTALVTNEHVNISKLAIARLEALVQSALKERGVRAVLIDEAQHLAPLVEQKKGYGPELRLMADGLKILGLNSGTLIVLFGTAELLTLPNLTAQLGRRSQLIHFRRYRWHDPEDQAVFKWVVEQFIKSWPALLPKGLLLDELPFLYTGCLGCVGILSDWLAAAMNKACKGSCSVTKEILKRTALRKTRLLQIHAEAQECEKAFANEEFGPEDLIKIVCSGVALEPDPEEADNSQAGAATGSNDKEKQPSRPKPGKRSQTKGYDAYQPTQNAA